MKKPIYFIVSFIVVLTSSCYKDKCEYSPTALTYKGFSLELVDNYGREPEVFDGNTITAKTFGIYYQMYFKETLEDVECFKIPDSATKKIQLFTLNNFNTNYPANSNITAAASLLTNVKEVPTPLLNSTISTSNFFLLNESPNIDTIQQFVVISINRYNDTISIDTTRAIMITQ